MSRGVKTVGLNPSPAMYYSFTVICTTGVGTAPTPPVSEKQMS